ncbi:hypothetical protein PG994_006840 [Apiospora phragmitis]|uniref:Uncharacterized protein n=1 Tax=Apiospora phragmitis TaxID=2905665 RepID=A0ABR1VG71_9PEZI
MLVAKVIAMLAGIEAAVTLHGNHPSTQDFYSRDVPSTTLTKVRELLSGALKNARSRNRAKECENFSENFANQTLTFLNYWKSEDYYVPREGAPKTEKDLLERLVEYQIVRDTVKDQGRLDAFPEAIVDQIRGAHDIVSKEGVSTGAHPHVLNALDTIFNDVCAKTRNVQIPFRLQEIVDVVLRGLEVNPQLTRPEALVQRTACDCRGTWPCEIYLMYFWDKETSKWECRCFGETRSCSVLTPQRDLPPT